MNSTEIEENRGIVQSRYRSAIRYFLGGKGTLTPGQISDMFKGDEFVEVEKDHFEKIIAFSFFSDYSENSIQSIYKIEKYYIDCDKNGSFSAVIGRETIERSKQLYVEKNFLYYFTKPFEKYESLRWLIKRFRKYQGI